MSKDISEIMVRVLEGLLEDAKAGKFQVGDLVMEDRGNEPEPHMIVMIAVRGKPKYLTHAHIRETDS